MSPAPPHFQTIGVIVGKDLIGDALIKLPFLRALRQAFPDAGIHWITSEAGTVFSDVLREKTRGLIDCVHERPVWLAVRGQGSGVGESCCRPPNPDHETPFFDLLIDTRGKAREARAARKLPHRVFIAPAFGFLLSDRRPFPFWRRPRHLSDRLLQLVELAAGYRPPCDGILPADKDALETARRILPPGPVYIGLAPGAGNPVKKWPLEKFEAVAAAQTGKGRVPVFILGPDERDRFEALKARFPAAKFPLQDRDAWGTTAPALDHTLAVGSRLALAIANDSGASHILAAAGCPLLSLFGPTSPAKVAPRARRNIVIRAQDFGSAQMDAIPCETVNAAIDSFIETQR